VEEAFFYVRSRRSADIEQFKRDDYNSKMLYLIAQPTRKDPNSVPTFNDLYGEKDWHGDDKDARGIMDELMERLGGCEVS